MNSKSADTVRKRLHISGLTPSITANDISARLKGFGNVLALDGFGALDGVGQPRKFAYVTLEATEPNLSRCLNVLSGTTWKGAKLRIGEAKPDYLQRLEAERGDVAERPLKRRRLLRGVQGVHAKDMTLVDAYDVDKRPGWYKTPLSHLIRPMKMRPTRPLPPPVMSGASKDNRLNPKKSGLRTSSRLHVLNRPRLIDPRLYGSTHLCGDMLNAVIIHQQALEEDSSPSPSHDQSPIRVDDVPPVVSNNDAPPTSESDSQASSNDDSLGEDFAEEKRRNLALLGSMFDDGASDWVGNESIDSDVETHMGDTKDEAVNTDAYRPPKLNEGLRTDAAPDTGKSNSISLKDMFKPRAEEAGFSLLSGLGEIEIDPTFDLDFIAHSTAPTNMTETASDTRELTSAGPSTGASSFTLDGSLPLFFPQPDNPRAKDLFSIARAEGWEFQRSGDANSIRQRWEAAKGPLTKQWKRRYREAVKARRRFHGAGEGEDA